MSVRKSILKLRNFVDVGAALLFQSMRPRCDTGYCDCKFTFALRLVKVSPS